MDAESVAARWDDEYRNERYANEPPVAFVTTILDGLRADHSTRNGTGLYVGCGNGRNYLPLLDSGLYLIGLDVSAEALKRLAERRRALSPTRLVCGDFRAFESAGRFAYVIAIQVFQHGGDADVAAYLDKTASLLESGGLFFLRVNSVATQIHHAHTVVEQNPWGGLTVRYDEGPKRGLLVHFYSKRELFERLDAGFVPVTEPREEVTTRAAPKTGSWAQWEGVWRRRDRARASRLGGEKGS